MSEPTPAGLLHLARLYGVQPNYRNVYGERTEAATEALLAVLAAAGAPPVLDPANPTALIQARRAELWQRRVPPVLAAFAGEPSALRLQLPQAEAIQRLDFRLEYEDGGVKEWSVQPGANTEVKVRVSEGTVAILVPLPAGLPLGYHTLRTSMTGQTWSTLVVAAPAQAYQPPPGERWWGTFLPLYALQTQHPWRTGDFGDLAGLAAWTGGLGGRIAGTLPLLASFLDGDPYDPSPYAPMSRLAWNELYIDVQAVPELQDAAAIRLQIGSPDFQAELARLGANPQVDYTALLRRKRQALAGLAEAFFENGAAHRQAEFAAFVAGHPHIADYARFRAAGERQGKGWPAWPDPLRSGTITAQDVDPTAERYHLYVQWLADQQLAGIAGAVKRGAAGLYLDLPLGVHGAGYDTWRHRDLFATGVTTGAPPDALFIDGQNWGFPPLHPERLRASGYAYFIAALRHHLQYARALRIDHVMGLYRQFWVPQGFGPRDGVYLRYPAHELAAILCLESHRTQTVMVGENLGVVPQRVSQLIERRGLRPMDVAPFSPTGDPTHALAPPPVTALASLNTHDTPTFAGWWHGRDLDDQLDLGLIDAASAESQHNGRTQVTWSIGEFLATHDLAERPNEGAPPLPEVVSGVLRWLARSQAWAVLVNLEDLWQEERPQNVPGTYRERPNWLRKATQSWEAFQPSAFVQRVLRAVDSERRNAP